MTTDQAEPAPERPQSLHCRLCHTEVPYDDVGIGVERVICLRCLHLEAGALPHLTRTLLRDVIEAAGKD